MAQEQVGGDPSAARTSVTSWISVLAGTLGESGIERMRRDAEVAIDELSISSSSPEMPAAVVLLALADLLVGSGDGVNALGAAVDYARAAAGELRGWPGSLTNAELRLLPLLTTQMTLAEIGTQLAISRHTVKSHAISIYRRLGVSSRTEAINRAIELDLLRPTLVR